MDDAKQLEKQLTDVVFKGYLTGDKKIRELLDADLYLFPTMHGEGCPITVLEAMMYGSPVITRNIGGLGDFFEHEKMGFITDSVVPQIFANFVDRLIHDSLLHKEVSNCNYQYARKYFVVKEAVVRLENVIKETAGKYD